VELEVSVGNVLEKVCAVCVAEIIPSHSHKLFSFNFIFKT
jgi:hypothetical protein